MATDNSIEKRIDAQIQRWVSQMEEAEALTPADARTLLNAKKVIALTNALKSKDDGLIIEYDKEKMLELLAPKGTDGEEI